MDPVLFLAAPPQDCNPPSQRCIDEFYACHGHEGLARIARRTRTWATALTRLRRPLRHLGLARQSRSV